MRVLTIAITHNCYEVLPFFFRHYETFSDEIWMFDDGSDDGSKELSEFHATARSLTWPYPGSGIQEDLFLEFYYSQMRHAKRLGFDWLIIADPDEMFYAPNIRQVLLDAKADQLDMIRAVGFNLVGPKFPSNDGESQIYELNPMGVYAPVYSKCSIVRPGADINWLRGRQSIEHCSVRMNQRATVKLLHARYFGRDYTAQKNAKNYAAVGDDKAVAWSCSPSHTGEHSPTWAESVIKDAFNVVDFNLSQMDDSIQSFDTKGVKILNPR